MPTTDSKLIERAQLPQLLPSHGQAALAELCANYWRPIRTVMGCQSIRRRMRDHRAPDHTTELTHDFIVELLHSGVAGSDRRVGSFRRWLNQAIENFLLRKLQHERRKKRDSRKTSALEDLTPFAYATCEPRHSFSPERLLSGSMAICAVNEAWEATRRWYAARANADRFDALEQFIPLDELADLEYAPVAAQLGLELGTVSKAVHDLRERYRDELRRQIRATVPSEEDVDDELRALIRWSTVMEHA